MANNYLPPPPVPSPDPLSRLLARAAARAENPAVRRWFAALAAGESTAGRDDRPLPAGSSPPPPK